MKRLLIFIITSIATTIVFSLTAHAACIVENNVVIGYNEEFTGNEIEIPSTVHIIGRNAFYSVRGISSIYIPTSVVDAEDITAVFYSFPSVVYGHNGTFAEMFAEQYRIKFISLGPNTSTLDNFVTRSSYNEKIFQDIDEDAWYGLNRQGVVASVVELGLMEGMGNDIFAPDSNLRLVEAIVLACRIHNIYHGGAGTLEDICQWQGRSSDSALWYTPYLEYAKTYSIMQEFYMAPDETTCERLATRAEVAYLLARSLPDEEMKSQVSEMFFVDVDLPWWEGGPAHSASSPDYYYYIPYIYQLQRAGVIVGYEDNSFHPNQNITRAETAALVSRLTVTGIGK